MDESRTVVDAIKNLALQLLDLVGVPEGQENGLFVIVGGGSDDVVGMMINTDQFEGWRRFGGLGDRVYTAFLRHANDSSPAFGSSFFSIKTLEKILVEVRTKGTSRPVSECLRAYMATR